MKIGQYLETYSKEKIEEVGCNNIKCPYYDNSGLSRFLDDVLERYYNNNKKRVKEND